jgi:hypothetical protein
MKSVKVTGSSTVARLGYHNRQLFVQLINGQVYQYRNVPKEVAINFAAAKSKGKFLNAEILGVYESEKLN